MKKIYLVILFYLILFIGCDKSSCDYASFEFKTEGSDKAQEGFQIILHSIWDNRIELIGRNYISGEFWNFNQGDYLELNDHYIIHYKIDTAVIDTLFHKNELTNKLDSIQTKMIDIIEPKIIITLGRFSMAKFIPGVKISDVHGKKKTIDWKGRKMIIVPMYHPAAGLRNGEMKRRTIKDFSKIPDILIETKQIEVEQMELM